LRVEEDGAGVHKDTAIVLVKVLDSPGFVLKLNGTSHSSREFLIWKLDAGELGMESTGNERTQ
jgi:hypothetical protein